MTFEKSDLGMTFTRFCTLSPDEQSAYGEAYYTRNRGKIEQHLRDKAFVVFVSNQAEPVMSGTDIFAFPDDEELERIATDNDGVVFAYGAEFPVEELSPH